MEQFFPVGIGESNVRRDHFHLAGYPKGGRTVKKCIEKVTHYELSTRIRVVLELLTKIRVVLETNMWTRSLLQPIR